MPEMRFSFQAIDAERAEGGDKMKLFSNAVEGEGLSSETTEAAANLDAAVSDLTHKFAEGTDFFKLLVDVFSSQLCGPEQTHLKSPSPHPQSPEQKN